MISAPETHLTPAGINMTGLRCGGSLWLRDNRGSALRVDAARIGGGLFAWGSFSPERSGALSGQDLKTGRGGIDIQRGHYAFIDLAGAATDGDLFVAQCALNNSDADHPSSLLNCRHVVVSGSVNVSQCTVAGSSNRSVDVSLSRIGTTLSINNCEVDNSVFLDSAHAHTIGISGRIGGELSVINTTVHVFVLQTQEHTDSSTPAPEPTVVGGPVRLNGTAITGWAEIRGVHASGGVEIRESRLSVLKICGVRRQALVQPRADTETTERPASTAARGATRSDEAPHSHLFSPPSPRNRKDDRSKKVLPFGDETSGQHVASTHELSRVFSPRRDDKEKTSEPAAGRGAPPRKEHPQRPDKLFPVHAARVGRGIWICNVEIDRSCAIEAVKIRRLASDGGALARALPGRVDGAIVIESTRIGGSLNIWGRAAVRNRFVNEATTGLLAHDLDDPLEVPARIEVIGVSIGQQLDLRDISVGDASLEDHSGSDDTHSGDADSPHHRITIDGVTTGSHIRIEPVQWNFSDPREELQRLVDQTPPQDPEELERWEQRRDSLREASSDYQALQADLQQNDKSLGDVRCATCSGLRMVAVDCGGDLRLSGLRLLPPERHSDDPSDVTSANEDNASLYIRSVTVAGRLELFSRGDFRAGENSSSTPHPPIDAAGPGALSVAGSVEAVDCRVSGSIDARGVYVGHRLQLRDVTTGGDLLMDVPDAGAQPDRHGTSRSRVAGGIEIIDLACKGDVKLGGIVAPAPAPARARTPEDSNDDEPNPSVMLKRANVTGDICFGEVEDANSIRPAMTDAASDGAGVDWREQLAAWNQALLSGEVMVIDSTATSLRACVRSWPTIPEEQEHATNPARLNLQGSDFRTLHLRMRRPDKWPKRPLPWSRSRGPGQIDRENPEIEFRDTQVRTWDIRCPEPSGRAHNELVDIGALFVMLSLAREGTSRCERNRGQRRPRAAFLSIERWLIERWRDDSAELVRRWMLCDAIEAATPLKPVPPQYALWKTLLCYVPGIIGCGVLAVAAIMNLTSWPNSDVAYFTGLWAAVLLLIAPGRYSAPGVLWELLLRPILRLSKDAAARCISPLAPRARSEKSRHDDAQGRAATHERRPPSPSMAGTWYRLLRWYGLGHPSRFAIALVTLQIFATMFLLSPVQVVPSLTALETNNPELLSRFNQSEESSTHIGSDHAPPASEASPRSGISAPPDLNSPLTTLHRERDEASPQSTLMNVEQHPGPDHWNMLDSLQLGAHYVFPMLDMRIREEWRANPYGGLDVPRLGRITPEDVVFLIALCAWFIWPLVILSVAGAVRRALLST